LPTACKTADRQENRHAGLHHAWIGAKRVEELSSSGRPIT
jgi:hypothetical protein